MFGYVLFVLLLLYNIKRRGPRRRLVSASLAVINDYRNRQNLYPQDIPLRQPYYNKVMVELIDATRDVN